MFKNIPFILRRFSRHKLTTSLHVIGLTLGHHCMPVDWIVHKA